MTNKNQVDLNYEFFKSQINDLISKGYEGKYVLIHNQKIIEFFNNFEDAIKAAALMKFQTGTFSVQKISRKDVNLGYISVLQRA